ncbi:MAG: deoxyribose-phosphate aldolase [Bacteroidales bacterium]|nr:deoxyribose-phosphate aldolase [Bacteroidales bacterium]
MFLEYPYSLSEVKLRAQQIDQDQISDEDLISAYKTIFECIDLTTLEATDNAETIKALCEKALNYSNTGDGSTVAAVCIYMPFIKQAKNLLAGSGLQVATVACSFPSGQLPLPLKLAEVGWAAAEGADEIDMVISRGKMIENDYDTILNEVQSVKKACGNAHLKVILETGELQSVELIRKASELALLGGADFLKTSTGKVSPAATPEAAVIMLDSIMEYYLKTGKKVGFKPAGGIAEPAVALTYYKLVKRILGDEWLNKKLFRIGASRLADKVKTLIS